MSDEQEKPDEDKMPDNEEALARMRAGADQLAAQSPEVAKLVAIHFKALLDEGFDGDTALPLTIAYQQILLS